MESKLENLLNQGRENLILTSLVKFTKELVPGNPELMDIINAYYNDNKTRLYKMESEALIMLGYIFEDREGDDKVFSAHINTKEHTPCIMKATLSSLAFGIAIELNGVPDIKYSSNTLKVLEEELKLSGFDIKGIHPKDCAEDGLKKSEEAREEIKKYYNSKNKKNE